MALEEGEWDGNQGEWDPETYGPPETYGQQTDGQDAGGAWQDPNTEQVADWSDGGSAEQVQQEPLSPDEHVRVLYATYNNFPQQYELWSAAMREAFGEKFDQWENGQNLDDPEVIEHFPDAGGHLTRILATDPQCQVPDDPLAPLYQKLHEGLRDFKGGRVYDQDLIDIIIHTRLVPLTVENCESLKREMDEAYKGSEIETVFISNVATELAALNYDGEGEAEPLALAPVERQPIVTDRRREQITTIRSDWLFENARIARFYYRHCEGGNAFLRFMSEVGTGPGFRIYIALWLFCATVMGCFLGWHLQFTILIDLFLPAKSKYMVSIGYFAMFLLSIIFMGSYVTALDRIWTGWLYFDDETYFADEDFAIRYREKNPNAKGKYNGALDAYKVCPHLLPPYYKRTFLNLPTNWMRRESWMTLAVLLTTTCPFLYALIYGISQKESVVTMIGHYVSWNVCTVLCFTIVYWAYTGYFAFRKKYGAIRRTRQAHKEAKEAGNTATEFDDNNHSWYNDTDVLAEFGLNERSITENLFVMVTSLAALVFFWIASYDDFHSEVTAEWIITSGLIAIIMLAVRETWRSESIRDMVPVVMLVLIVIFFAVGLAGAIKMKGGGVCVYIILVLGSQMMMLRHRVEDEVPNIQIALTFLRKAFHLLTLGIRDEAERTSSKIQGLEELVNLVSNARAEPTAQTPRGKMARHLQQKLTISTKEAKKLHRAGQPQRDESYIPLGGVLKMLFMPCLWKCCSSRYDVDDLDIEDDEEMPAGLDDAAKKKKMKEIERLKRQKRKRLQLEKEDRYGYWRLPRSYWGDDIAQSQEVYQKFKYEPTDKLIQTISPKLSCWYMLVFLIIAILGIAVVGEDLHGNLSVGDSKAVPAAAGERDYPICRMKLPFLPSGISITDVAMMAEIAQSPWNVPFKLSQWFGTELFQIPAYQCVKAIDPDDGILKNVKCGGYTETETFYNFYHPASSTNFIVFRTPKKSQQIMNSIDVWGESMLLQVMSSIIPILKFFSLDVERDFVYGFSLVKQALENEDHDLDSTTEKFAEYMERWQDYGLFYINEREPASGGSAYSENMRVVLVGHGFNGGMAKINGGRFNMPVISFSAPGVSWIEKRFDLEDNSYQTVTIVPEVDIIPDVDRQEGVVQHIQCKEDSTAKCHHMKTTLCELMTQCGRRDREYAFCPV
eukprot:TRINITY_DN3953_c0_g1_i1.p1 TRINITY_DN3953_c0_g1~~TRINITY_DN3953_c0_g1_i1.p1  ORF type:complete len:1179 (+),score=208.92 TRINITY_DN3953_c0_g1_i1:124-3660(+)